MKNPIEGAQEHTHERNIESYLLKWRQPLLEENYEGKWVLINDGTPHGVFGSSTEAEHAESLLQREKPPEPSTIIQILPETS